VARKRSWSWPGSGRGVGPKAVVELARKRSWSWPGSGRGVGPKAVRKRFKNVRGVVLALFSLFYQEMCDEKKEFFA
jgi:hypothetical protein